MTGAATVCVWLGIGLVVHSGLVLRNPPAGSLVYEKDDHRVYVLRSIDPATLQRVREWAIRYSGAVLDSDAEASLRAASTSDSGEVADVETARGPRETVLYDGRRTSLGKNDLAVWVYDHSISPAQLIARVRVALFTRSS